MARQSGLVIKKKSVMLSFVHPPSSFDPFFSHSQVETEKQPILRGKEVEGKLLIGHTEHSCVLLFSPNSICQKCRAA